MFLGLYNPKDMYLCTPKNDNQVCYVTTMDLMKNKVFVARLYNAGDKWKTEATGEVEIKRHTVKGK